jgi:hypothetical protein
MKNRTIKELLIFCSMMLLLGSCGQTPKGASEGEAVVEPVDFTAFRDEITEIIQNSFKGIKILDFLNEVGASYIYDITVPTSEAERFETKFDQSWVVGMYAADMYYAHTFKRFDMVVRSAKTVDMLAAKLGIMGNFSKLERIKFQEENTDSLKIMLNQTWEDFHASIKESDRPDIEALIFVGANIEWMYLLSQLTLYAKDNQAMIDYLSQKGEYARGLLKLLEIVAAEEAVKPYYEKMKPVVSFFDEHQQITTDNLSVLADLIESARNELIQK